MYITLAALADKVLRGTEELDGTQITAMTIIGLSVVFFALLILVIYLTVSGSFFKAAKPGRKAASETKKQAPAKPAPTAEKPAAPKAAVPAAAPAEDDSEVVAVIMAAIAAMGAADGKQYRIKSVRPVSGGSGRSAWAQAGIAELTRPF